MPSQVVDEVSGRQITNSGSFAYDVYSGNHVGPSLEIGALGTRSSNLSATMNKLHVLNAARLLPNSLSAKVKVGLFNLDHHPAFIR